MFWRRRPWIVPHYQGRGQFYFYSNFRSRFSVTYFMNNHALTFIGRQTQDWPHGYRPDSLWQATLAHNTSICQAFGDRVVLSPHKRVHFLSFPSPLLSTSGISKGLNSIWKKVLGQKTTSISDTFIRKSVETHVRQAEPKARDALATHVPCLRNDGPVTLRIVKFSYIIKQTFWLNF